MSGGRESHPVLGGEVHVYRRPGSSRWQAATFLAGREHRVSTKTDSLAQAKAFAEDWYLTLRGKSARGELKSEKTFKQVAAIFEAEYETLTEGERSPEYVQGHKDRIRVHLNPFFGVLGLSEITSGKVQEYRVHRRTVPKASPSDAPEGKGPRKAKKPPARSTLHHEIVTLRQVLKTAIRHGWLAHLPDLSAPYKTSGKVAHRAWFGPEEYKQLYTATRKRAQDPKNHRRRSVANLHDYVLFLANTGLRPDEAARLEYRDVKIVDDPDTEERILEIAVRGKRGTGFCKSTRGAVRPFERLRDRTAEAAQLNAKKAGSTAQDAYPRPTDLLFPHRQTKLFNEILEAEGLKHDREGQVRTAYSLRHTYISMRLLEGADIYQVAKNCRTSVEMIQKFYASHIATALNAAAINTRRPTARRDQATAH